MVVGGGEDVMTAAPKIQHHSLIHLLHTENTFELLIFLLLVKITCKFVTQLRIPAFIYHTQYVSQPFMFCKENCKSFSTIYNFFLHSIPLGDGKDNICNTPAHIQIFLEHPSGHMVCARMVKTILFLHKQVSCSCWHVY
jgi:hypothetical protein